MGIFYKNFENDQVALNYMDANFMDKVPYTYMCFGAFNAYAKPKDGPIYLSTACDRKYAQKIIDLFNAEFTNIQIRVLAFYEYNSNAWGTTGRVHTGKLCYIFYTIEFNERYSNFLKHILYVMIGELIRNINIEYTGYDRIETFADYFDYEKTDSLAGLTFYVNVDYSEFKLFDNVEEITKVFTDDSVYPGLSPKEQSILGACQYAYRSYQVSLEYIEKGYFIPPTRAILALRQYYFKEVL